jgi:hypothetical protein
VKRAEWIGAVQTIRALWPNAEIPDVTIAAWYEEVADIELEHAVAAIRTFARDGAEWPPTGGKIRRRVAELLLDPPDWGEVLEQLRLIRRTPAAKATGKLEEIDGHEVAEVVYPREDVIARTHPMIVAFFLHLGSQTVLQADPTDGNSEARLRDKWREFRQTAERRLSYTGLDCGDLPALRRAVRQDRQLQPAGGVFAGIRKQIARPATEGDKDG